MQSEDLELDDKESVLFLKVVRNNPFNHVKRLAIRKDSVEFIFAEEAALEPVTKPKEEVMGWKDKDWQKFFEEHEPLM